MTAAKPNDNRLYLRIRLPDYRRWPDRPRCADADPAVFFPAPGDAAAVQSAKAICGDCSVREECLEAALSLSASDDNWGVWGGYSARERAALRQKQARKAAA